MDEHTPSSELSYSIQPKVTAKPFWKIKSEDADGDYKKSACHRERIRLEDMNKAYEALRKILPNWDPQGKKMSKIEALRMAIDYMKQLQALLDLTSPLSVGRPKEYSTDELYVGDEEHYAESDY